MFHQESKLKTDVAPLAPLPGSGPAKAHLAMQARQERKAANV
jgi:hypothetical protein